MWAMLVCKQKILIRNKRVYLYDVMLGSSYYCDNFILSSQVQFVFICGILAEVLRHMELFRK